MKIKLYYLVNKSFVKEKKFILPIFLLCTISMAILLSFYYFVDISSLITMQSIEADCGRYDIIVGNISEDDIENLKQLKGVVSYHEYLEEEIYYEDSIYCFVYSDSEYLEYSSFSYISGEFPKDADEIMCEPWILRQMGISSENMIGATVSIANKQYKVSGLCVNKSYSSSEDQLITILCNSKNKSNCVMLELESDEIDKMITNINLKVSHEEAVIGRNLDKEQASGETRNSTESTTIFMIFIIMVSVVIMFGNCIYLFVNHISKSINIYLRLGINKKTVSFALFCFFGSLILLSNTLGFVLYIPFSKYISNIGFSENDIKYLYSIKDVISTDIVILFVIISVLELLGAIIIDIKTVLYTRECKIMGSVNMLCDVNPKSNNKRLFLSMAKNNLKMARKNSRIMVLAISISIITFISVCYFVDTLTNVGIDYGDTKYIIKFQDDSFLSETEIVQKEKIINELLSDENLKASTQNIFYTTAEIDKKSIDREFVSYLKMYVDYNAAFENKLTSVVPIMFGIISEKQVYKYEQIELNKNEAILYNMPSNLNIERGLIKDEDFTIEVKDYENNKFQIYVKEIRERIPFDVFSETVALILVVSDEIFNQLSDSQKTNNIYIANDVEESILFNYVGKSNFVQIENVGHDKQTINDGVNKIKFLLTTSLIVCVVALIISMVTACYTRIQFYKNEYVTLDAIGISLKKIVRIPIYEFILMIIPIIISSFIGSIVITKLLYFIISKEHMILYSYPMSSYILAVTILLIITVICSFFVIRTIKGVRKSENKLVGV